MVDWRSRELLPLKVIALIDYDNLDRMDRHRGVRHVMTKLLQALGRRRLPEDQKIDCRLYGGWYDRVSLSSRAQKLVPELRREFPRTIAVAGSHHTGPILVRAELALALACDPKVELTHTYRRHSLPPSLRCMKAPFPDCLQPSQCPVARLHPFIRNKSCPVHGCCVAPHAVLHRAEQKLVDSMIVIDLVHLALVTSEPLIVVSADEDLWPGIRFVLLLETPIVHIVPRRAWSGSVRYLDLETETYMRIVI